MIFLAVTMGFFAKNIREMISDSEREKDFMKSLIKDIRDVQASIHADQLLFEQRV